MESPDGPIRANVKFIVFFAGALPITAVGILPGSVEILDAKYYPFRGGHHDGI
jgi:hypothetical protein